MKNWPLQRRIVGWSALSTAIALLTFAIVVAFALYYQQVEVIDDRLAVSANLLVSRHPADGPIDLDTLQALTVAPKHRQHAATSLFGYVLLRAGDRSVLRAQPAALADAVGAQLPRKHHFGVRVAGERLRCGWFPIGDTVLVLAASLEPAFESVEDLSEAALIAIPAALLVVAAGSWWIARRALTPIAEITRTAAAINTQNLAARLPELETNDEIAAHTRVLNAMFDRLQRGFEQATRFTADAAHELRTPLTILRGQIEDALRTARLESEQESLLIGLLEETIGLQKIADNLLLLARLDTGKANLSHEPVDLSRLMTEVREDAELLAAPKSIVIEADISPDVTVVGDATMLRRVALNLVDNAIKFNRASGSVRLSLKGGAAGVQLTVGNTGSGIPYDRRAGLFERFYRPDSGRDRASGGSGLGLSLSREIVTAHGGEIRLNRSETDWTEFTVTLPLTRPTPEGNGPRVPETRAPQPPTTGGESDVREGGRA